MNGAKYYIVAMAILCLGACGGRQTATTSQPQDVIAANIQTVAVSHSILQEGVSDTLHFGKMRQGEIIKKQLRITNDDTTPMIILRHITSCGCTTVNYERKPIASGESTIIDFEFNSRGEVGWQMKLMEFYFAEKDTPLKIYIEAEIE